MTSPKFAIIGGGIVGSTAAYYLARAGGDVTLFEEETGQATKAAAGIICPWFSQRRNKPWYYLVSSGAEFLRQLMADLQADTFETEAIFQEDGALLIRNKAKQLERDQKQGALKRETAPSIGEIQTLTATEVNQRFPLLETDCSATWVSGGARVDGTALIETLHQAILKHGGKIIAQKATLQQIEPRIQIGTEQSSKPVFFDRLLLSPGPHLPQLLAPFGYEVDIRPQKGQLFSVYLEEWEQQHWPVVMPPGQFDIIPFNNGEIVIGATHEDEMGADLTVDQMKLDELSEAASQWMPALIGRTIHRRKVGTRAYTSDYGVLVGQVPQQDHIWAISGLGSSGLTSGPFLGYQWAQLMLTEQWAINPVDFPIEAYITIALD